MLKSHLPPPKLGRIISLLWDFPHSRCCCSLDPASLSSPFFILMSSLSPSHPSQSIVGIQVRACYFPQKATQRGELKKLGEKVPVCSRPCGSQRGLSRVVSPIVSVSILEEGDKGGNKITSSFQIRNVPSRLPKRSLGGGFSSSADKAVPRSGEWSVAWWV